MFQPPPITRVSWTPTPSLNKILKPKNKYIPVIIDGSCRRAWQNQFGGANKIHTIEWYIKEDPNI